MGTAKTEILIIDDNKGCIELIASTLEDSGYRAVKAIGPYEGLKKASELLPDLIILDWLMPDMDGQEVLHRLKDNKITRDIPVIMATGVKTESDNLKLAMDAGAVDFVRKPIDEVEMMARINSALRLNRYYTESQQRLKAMHSDEKEVISNKVKKIKSELAYKKEETINYALQLLEYMRNTKGMLGELKEIDHVNSDENSDKIRDVISKYQNDSFEKKLKEFEKRFDVLHSDFYQKLLKDYPNLSSNDRKLCVYFRMDMENKDIAILTFSSYDAVRKARLRLKQKLGLSVEDSLVEFLNAY